MAEENVNEILGIEETAKPTQTNVNQPTAAEVTPTNNSAENAQPNGASVSATHKRVAGISSPQYCVLLWFCYHSASA